MQCTIHLHISLHLAHPFKYLPPIAYVQEHHSLPAFLSAVTLRLFAERLDETPRGIATRPSQELPDLVLASREHARS